MNNNNQCCCNISSKLNMLVNNSANINCLVELILCSIPNYCLELQTIYATLAANNPLTIAGEYPDQLEDKVVYSTTKVRFLDMLNPNIYVIFKGTFNIDLPVYFKDIIEFEHTVTFEDINTPAKANLIVNNYNYPALYVGNYIILNPSALTLLDFKDGLLS